MKFLLVAFTVLLGVVVLSTEAIPAEKAAHAINFEHDYVPIQERADRHRRVTCDLLSVDTPWGSLNHAACAAHCLVLGKGFRGGHCNGEGICVCRR